MSIALHVAFKDIELSPRAELLFVRSTIAFGQGKPIRLIVSSRFGLDARVVQVIDGPGQRRGMILESLDPEGSRSLAELLTRSEQTTGDL